MAASERYDAPAESTNGPAKNARIVLCFGGLSACMPTLAAARSLPRGGQPKWNP